MENQRFLLYFTLFFIAYLLWAEWQMAYGPAPVEATSIVSQETIPTAAENINSVPVAADVNASNEVSAQSNVKSNNTSVRIHVVTDVLDIEIDTKGGDIRKATLQNYAIEAEEPDEKYILLNDQEYQYHIAQSGIVSKEKQSAPTHNAVYATQKTSYRLSEDESELIIPLIWKGNDGVEVVKTYKFYRGKYSADVNVKVTAGNNDWSGSQYLQLVRTQPSSEGSSLMVRSYTGGVVYNDEIKYEKYDFDDMDDENLKLDLDDGWLAMIEHYFLVAWIPEEGNKNLYYSRQPSGTYNYILGSRGPGKKIAAGDSAEFNSQLYVGPKIQGHLDEVSPGLAEY